MDVRTERPRTAGRIAPTGRVTPTVHQNPNAGRRKAIPVPPPRVPTPMPTANNNKERNNANVVEPPTVPIHKKEPRENIARIAKRYLDDNMQQAWINPRLISMINMEAVTSTDYDPSNLSRNFNQVGFNTYNYSQFEDKYKPQQILKYGDEYLEYGKNSVKMGLNAKWSSRHQQEISTKFNQRHPRSHSQPEKQHHHYNETRSKSQDSRELTFYQIDPPLKYDSQNIKYHHHHHHHNHRSGEKILQGNKELTFYEIDGPPVHEKKEVKFSQPEKIDKRNDKIISSKHNNHGKLIHQEQKITTNFQMNRSQSDLGENQLTNFSRLQNGSYSEPPKYRPFDRPPKYQETPPKIEPPPKYHQEPPKYSEIVKKQEDTKQTQEERSRRPTTVGGGVVSGTRGGNVHGVEAPSNMASITPTARETTRGGAAASRQRQQLKSTNINNDSTINKDDFHESSENFDNLKSSRPITSIVNDTIKDNKSKNTVDSLIKHSETTQSRIIADKSMIKLEKTKVTHDIGGKSSDKMKSVQDSVHKHESTKGKLNHDTLAYGGYKVENLKYYGELNFKSYGNIDKPPSTEKNHQHSSSEKSYQINEKCQGKLLQSYVKGGQSEKSVYSDKYGDHYYHRSSHVKPQNPYQVYQETKYSYNVSVTPGTPAQASAAAAFFARAAQKLNLSASPHRRRRSGDDIDEQPFFPNGYAALLQKSPPPAPPALLRRIGVKELSGVGKVKVMLRVSPGEGGSFFNADKRKKQVTLIDPASAQSSTAEDRRPTVAAPKMFAFDAIFTEEDSQTEICSSALTDVIHAVINGTDGCLFCLGHAGLGKTHTMLGTPEAGHTLGAIPCAITWLFRGISEQRQRTGARFSVRVSCVELSAGQQQLKDLLAAYANDSEQSPAVYLRDDPLFGTLQLQQHSELRAPTAERAAFYLDAAVAGRQREGDTHMLYTLHVYQYSVAGKGGVAGGRSRLHLMDLGNSDRGKSSGGIPLSGLGNILIAIFNGQKHLPYKEHKLTQLLKECLGSLTCHAAMIAHVSPNSQQYSETLTTVQLASRIHRMRRRKIKFIGNNGQGTGSGGSSGEEAARQNSECDPSSSDLSADTVIYVGPSTDDATDGEHPPVYIPSLNSGDNRCAMGRVLRGSAAERPNKIAEERSPAHKATKAVKALTQTASKQTSPAHSLTPKASPARKINSTKASASKNADSPNSKIPVAVTTGGSDEQWIDGPRISKSKVAEARHLLKDSHHKRETWIDGPMQLTTSLHQQHSGYGFMDSHKKSMIRKWVENQSSQIQRSKYNSRNDSKIGQSSQFKELSKNIDDDETSLSTIESESIKASEIEDITEKLGAKLNLLNVKSNTDSGLDLTASPIHDNSRSKLNVHDDEDDDEEIVVPPPLPLIEPLSNGVSREVSMESLNLSHKDIVLPSRHSLSSEDEILEIVEVEDLEPVPMQDSCLQVTEEDIALCMGENPLPESDQEEHPLRILSQENLTVVSTFTDSMSVMSDTERYRPQYQLPVGMGMLPRPYFDHEDFLEQESRHKFDQLARLHELYQSKLALANVSNSATYQRENSSSVTIRDAPSATTFRPPSRCQSLSLSDVLFNDNASNHGSTFSEPAYIAGKSEQEKICDNCRQTMSRPETASYWYPSSVAHLASPRRYCGKLGECNISSLRHPDGASNPNLKEEIERIPGNGASGSDPEEEYIEAKKLFGTNERSERTVTGKSDIEEDRKTIVATPLQISIPSSVPSSGRMQRKILSLGSSFGLNKDGYDSGADSTPRAAKLSPATLSRHRAESSGYDSIVRDSETSSIASDSSRHTNALQEHQGGALGVLTSTLCGCFSGGTTGGRMRAPGPGPGNSRGDSRLHRRGRSNSGQTRTAALGAAWNNVQDTQPTSAPAPS